MKQCKCCSKIKCFDDFTKDPRNNDGHGATCKDCYRKRTKTLYDLRPKKPRTTEQKKNRNQYERNRYRTITGWASVALNGCKSRNDCSLTRRDIVSLWHKQLGLCAITKQPLNFAAQNRAHDKPSIDRIDSSKGYYIDNIRIVWHFVNQAKNTFTDAELLLFCQHVVNGMRTTK